MSSYSKISTTVPGVNDWLKQVLCTVENEKHRRQQFKMPLSRGARDILLLYTEFHISVPRYSQLTVHSLLYYQIVYNKFPLKIQKVTSALSDVNLEGQQRNYEVQLKKKILPVKLKEENNGAFRQTFCRFRILSPQL